MRKKIAYYFVICILILIIPFFAFGIVNTVVSQKYETETGCGCISLTSGDNLCLIITLFAGLILLSIIGIILLLYFKNKIL